MTRHEKLLDKLSKIQAHADSAAEIGNEAEAEAFAGMLQQLCLKHKVAMSDIQLAELEQEEPIKEHKMDYKAGKVQVKQARNAWQQRLSNIVARAHFCRILVHRGSSRITLVGRKSDAAVAEYLFMTLCRSLNKIAQQTHDKEYRKYFKLGMTQEMKGFKRSFIDAFVIRLKQRFNEEKKTVETSSSTALVRVEQADAQVTDFMNQYTGRASALSTNRHFNEAGVRAGRAAANGINLKGNGIGAGRSSQGQLQ
tara:strand:+ start:697 stop:1455 length:759 start_codon:yes stop_codon:yes gene_type:complete